MSKYGDFSGPYFPVFGLNMEIYSVNFRIQSKYRKIWTRKNSVFGPFSHSDIHFIIHVIDAPRIDENDETKDDEVASFTNKYISCSILNKKYHTTTSCRKKKGVTCWFSAPWLPSERTLIVRGGKDTDKKVLTKSKKVLGHVLFQITQIDNLQSITLINVL